MAKWFNKQPRLIQIILLFIPVVNWVIEIGVRWSVAMTKKDFLHVLIAVLVTFGGVIIGWLDAIWCLINHHMILAK